MQAEQAQDMLQQHTCMCAFSPVNSTAVKSSHVLMLRPMLHHVCCPHLLRSNTCR